jgi:hypothetical protein
MNIIRRIANRIYADYLMPSRLGEYQKLLEASLQAGYEHLTIQQYYTRIKEKTLNHRKTFIHRHDIDTDTETARMMFAIEKKLDIHATYYFRLSTLDVQLMKEIHDFGSEASYHFEEIASFCKERNLKTRADVIQYLPLIREQFSRNFRNVEKLSGIKLHTVASHGDFVNRKLGIANHLITEGEAQRNTLGIECETYDDLLIKSFDLYVSDKPYPIYYSHDNIFDAIGTYNTICMLTHPRQWRTNWYVNTKDNLIRLYEGLKYSLI